MLLSQRFLISICALIAFACAEEKNPYKSRYETQSTLSDSPGDAGNSSPSSDSTGADAGNATGAADTTTAAKTDSIPKASLSAIQLICANPASVAKFAGEMAVLCVNGQPTQALANALAAPYKGGANPPLVTIKSVDNNGISEFIVLAVIEVPKALTAVFAKRDLTHKGTMTEGNATVTQTEVAATPAQGGDQLGSFDIKFDLTVKVGIITVADTRILQQDFAAINADKSILSAVSYLKPGAADNSENILANSVSFWIGDANSTKLISVNHQMVDNRGQAATAEQTVLAIGKRTMLDTYTQFSQ